MFPRFSAYALFAEHVNGRKENEQRDVGILYILKHNINYMYNDQKTCQKH